VNGASYSERKEKRCMNIEKKEREKEEPQLCSNRLANLITVPKKEGGVGIVG